RPHLPLGRHDDLAKLVALARGAGVAPVEVPGAARHAFVGKKVGRIAQHQIVDERDLTGHGTPPPRTIQLAAPVAPRPNRSLISPSGARTGRRRSSRGSWPATRR